MGSGVFATRSGARRVNITNELRRDDRGHESDRTYYLFYYVATDLVPVFKGGWDSLARGLMYTQLAFIKTDQPLL